MHLGGGLCDIANFRTLCTLCHSAVTRRQARERALSRAAVTTRSLATLGQAATGVKRKKRGEGPGGIEAGKSKKRTGESGKLSTVAAKRQKRAAEGQGAFDQPGAEVDKPPSGAANGLDRAEGQVAVEPGCTSDAPLAGLAASASAALAKKRTRRTAEERAQRAALRLKKQAADAALVTERIAAMAALEERAAAARPGALPAARRLATQGANAGKVPPRAAPAGCCKRGAPKGTFANFAFSGAAVSGTGGAPSAAAAPAAPVAAAASAAADGSALAALGDGADSAPESSDSGPPLPHRWQPKSGVGDAGGDRKQPDVAAAVPRSSDFCTPFSPATARALALGRRRLRASVISVD